MQIKVPIGLFFYNRPDTLKDVISQLTGIDFPCIYLISDGPDPKKSDDQRLVLECRSIAEHYFEMKKIKTIYRSRNVGLFENITSGIEEVFRHEDSCIFLEDDTVVSSSFFAFCDELLERYKYSTEIVSISGFKLQDSWKHPNYQHQSYFFSRYPQVWGWATWRTKWENYYDKNIEKWPEWRDSGKFDKLFTSRREAKFWHKKLENIYQFKHTWDWQLAFASFHNGLLTIVPAENLVTNIGIGRQDATFTRTVNSMRIRPHQNLDFPLKHPGSITQEEEYDKLVSRWFAPTIIMRIRMKTRRMKKSFFRSKS